jgi:hypothetical protein
MTILYRQNNACFPSVHARLKKVCVPAEPMRPHVGVHPATRGERKLPVPASARGVRQIQHGKAGALALERRSCVGGELHRNRPAHAQPAIAEICQADRRGTSSRFSTGNSHMCRTTGGSASTSSAYRWWHDRFKQLRQSLRSSLKPMTERSSGTNRAPSWNGATQSPSFLHVPRSASKEKVPLPSLMEIHTREPTANYAPTHTV